jgi:predicted MPP superfamily phosphohydrolase
MPKIKFVTFLSVVLVIYALINVYIFRHGWHALPASSSARGIYLVLYLLLAPAYVVARFLERKFLNWFTAFLDWIGAVWLGAMTYFLLAVVAIDILRLINAIVPFYPAFVTADYGYAKVVAFIVVFGIVGLATLGGYLNARNPRIKKLDLAINKKNPQRKELNIAVASDIHLGTIISTKRLWGMVNKINALDPDLVLIPGDLFDEDIGPVIKKNLGEVLRKIRSRFGVIAITGNHEYIGGVEAACNYMTVHGIKVLRDETIMVDDTIQIVGREDRSIGGFAGKKRKPLEELMEGIDKQRPVILMDHQPFHLEEAVQNGVDLQLSGHTHHGQLWPFNFITKRMYEVSWGYKKKENTHIYVSCGAGTWGPPIRTGNTPEIMHLRLRFA